MVLLPCNLNVRDGLQQATQNALNNFFIQHNNIVTYHWGFSCFNAGAGVDNGWWSIEMRIDFGIPHAHIDFMQGSQQWRQKGPGDAYQLDDAEIIAQIQNGVGQPLIPQVQAWLQGVILQTTIFSGTTAVELQLTQDPNRMMQP